MTGTEWSKEDCHMNFTDVKYMKFLPKEGGNDVEHL